jgi:hypothetical protein
VGAVGRERESGRRREAAAWLLAALVVAVAVFLVRDHTRGDTASYDEPVHVLAADYQVFHHSALPNLEHPPLFKELAGWGLRLFAPRPSDVPLLAPDGWFSASGRRFLFRNRVPPDRLLAAARAPMLLVFAALLVLVFCAARRLWGTAGGLFSLSLAAFAPNFLAHAGIVDGDVLIALFWLAAALVWGRLLRKRTLAGAAILAVVLGLAFSAKFTGLFLLPTLALAALGVRARAWLRGGPGGSRSESIREAGRDLALLGAAAAAALLVTLAVYHPCVSGMTVAGQQRLIRSYMRFSPGSALGNAAIAASPHSRSLAQFLGGLAAVAQQDREGFTLGFLNGRVSRFGFPGYLLTAFAVKSTLPLLAAAAALLAGALRRRLDRWDLVFGISVLYYFAFTFESSFSLGVRHALPVYPLLFVWAGRLPEDAAALGARLWGGRGRLAGGAAIAALAAAQVVTAARSHPHELSYFNPLGGGTSGGYRLLADSNVDWGLDLERLAREVRRRGVRDPTVVYFGGDDVAYRVGVANFSEDPRVRGRFIAVSATLWDYGPAFYAFYGRPDVARDLALLLRDLRARGRPIGRVGGSTFLFDLPPPPPAGARGNSGILRPGEGRSAE